VPPPTLVPTATLVPSATLVPPPTEPLPPTPFPPDVTLYQVMAGDNLYRISIRFNVPLEELIRANGILNPSRIYVGQVLVIP
jgi:LysM repeat protein